MKLQSNPVITTSVNATPRLMRQLFCGTNYCWPRLEQHKMFIPVSDAITEFDYILYRPTAHL